MALRQLNSSQANAADVYVWDRFVRAFHWIAALSFFVAYFSEDELLTVHVWAGYTLGVLVVLRIIWGFVGPKHARFSDFVCAPWTAWTYLIGLFTGRAKRYLGHSPAGGVMVLLLLAGSLATVWSGLELHAIENNAGPLAQSAMTQGGNVGEALAALGPLVRRAQADDDERRRPESASREDAEEFWEEIHEILADVMMALVIAHVLGVIVASRVHHENLARSMVSGFKRSP